MSDFLGRIAARAVGRAPLAGPRPATAFEGLGGDAAIEVVDTEIPAGPAPRAVATDGVTNPDAPAAAPAAVRSRPPGGEAASREPAASTSARTPAPERSRVREARDAAEPGEAALPLAAPRPERDAAQTVTRSTPAPVQPAAVAVAARPVVVAAVPALAHTPAPAPAPAAAPAAEPPPVRVHIGRLEVRANLRQPPPAEPRPRDEERPQELSLADYLRGRRAAG